MNLCSPPGGLSECGFRNSNNYLLITVGRSRLLVRFINRVFLYYLVNQNLYKNNAIMIGQNRMHNEIFGQNYNKVVGENDNNNRVV